MIDDTKLEAERINSSQSILDNGLDDGQNLKPRSAEMCDGEVDELEENPDERNRVHVRVTFEDDDNER